MAGYGFMNMNDVSLASTYEVCVCVCASLSAKENAS